MASDSQTKPNEEPPAGIQGKGTIDEPYDQGNTPENTSGKSTQTAGTSSQPINASAQTQTPSPAVATADKRSSTSDKGQKGESRGRESLKTPARARHEERDVSPGTMPDGSHATTSGERGEGYEPGRLSKLKGVFSIGKH